MRLKLIIIACILQFLWITSTCYQTTDQNTSDVHNIQTHARIDDEEYVKCGFSLALSNEFFNKFAKELLPSIFELIKEEISINKTIEVDVGMFILYLSSPKFEIVDIQYDKDKTSIELYNDNNSIGFHLADSLVNISMEYDIYLDPPILNDTGKLDLGYNHLSIDMVFSLEQKDPSGDLFLNFSESQFTVDPKDVYLNLNNTNDFDQILITVVKSISDPILRLISTALTDYLENVANIVIGFIPEALSIGKFSIDLSFYDFPNITDEYALSTWNGTFFPTGEELPFSNENELPRYDPDGKGIQFFLSEYTLKSLLYTATVADVFKFSITNNDTVILNTAYLKGLFPEITKEYGEKSPCALLIKVNTSDTLNLTITPQGVGFNGPVYLELDAIKDGETDYSGVFAINVYVDIDAILDISKDLTITIKITKIDIAATTPIWSNIGDISKSINSLLKRLLTIIKDVVNLLFSRGINLSNFLSIPFYIKDIELTAKQGFYEIQANPYLKTSDIIDN